MSMLSDAAITAGFRGERNGLSDRFGEPEVAPDDRFRRRARRCAGISPMWLVC